eukprot:COSAG06_NODE_8044_length_2289_cov_1.948882_1_plen_138_part_00
MLDEVACTVDVVADVLDEVVCTVDVVADVLDEVVCTVATEEARRMWFDNRGGLRRYGEAVCDLCNTIWQVDNTLAWKMDLEFKCVRETIQKRAFVRRRGRRLTRPEELVRRGCTGRQRMPSTIAYAEWKAREYNCRY